MSSKESVNLLFIKWSSTKNNIGVLTDVKQSQSKLMDRLIDGMLDIRMKQR